MWLLTGTRGPNSVSPTHGILNKKILQSFSIAQEEKKACFFKTIQTDRDKGAQHMEYEEEEKHLENGPNP